ncbi:MAG TPA: DedA family protein [Caulobacteraceae bacterium]|jgi:membrane protein DedA with SNARE-associated domain|nr:DedA family protein [Caulobacteraceae bacterium]
MHQLIPIVADFGYAAVFVFLLIESIGIPVPGEGILIAAALFAAQTHRLEIAAVLAAGMTAAFLGTCLGYLAGRRAGLPLLARYGRYIGLTTARQRLGQYLFLRHGGKIVFFGRFIAFLRAFEGLLAGVNRMPWRHFLLFNALGAAAWTTVVGLAAYVFGRTFVHLSKPFGLALILATVVALVVGFFYVRRAERVLQRHADAAILD